MSLQAEILITVGDGAITVIAQYALFLVMPKKIGFPTLMIRADTQHRYVRFPTSLSFRLHLRQYSNEK